MDDPAGVPAATTIGRVALRANDLDRLVEFYRTVIGLDVLTDDDERAVLGAGDAPLFELLAAPDAPARGRREAGLFHAAVRFPSRAALADALDRVERRWRLDGAADHLVSEALYLADPEDNGVELYRDRPREAWPVAADGTVEMETRPLDLDDLRAAGRGEAGAPPGTTVGHVHLEVTSLPAARQFYVDGLGLNVRQRYGESALFLAAGDYHHHVGLNVWNRRSERATGRGLVRFELLCPDDRAVAAVRDRLERRDVAVSPADGGFDAVDPDGIGVRVRASK